METNIIAWDIGGAHLKAALLNVSDNTHQVFLKPCPLWKGLSHLQFAVNAILEAVPKANYGHAITMTGELVDLFTDRDDGVKQILKSMTELLKDNELLIFAGKKGLLPYSHINAGHYHDIASANWLATGSYLAKNIAGGLLVDIGSTTTDILLLHNGQLITEAFSDYQRLISKELVYTGIVRTPVMAIAQRVVDNGQAVGLMAEYFATMADVYRVTGELLEAHDQGDSADGLEKTQLASARRLSRMIGCDFLPEELPRWRCLAKNLRKVQLQTIREGCELQLARCGAVNNYPLIGAGIGRFLVQEIARTLNRPYLDFLDFFRVAHPVSEINLADCAPAVALSCLALSEFHTDF